MAAVISVIMPFHNSETTLGAAIESLFSQNVSDCRGRYMNCFQRQKAVVQT